MGGSDKPPIKSVANGTYTLSEKLGAGSFGAIFLGTALGGSDLLLRWVAVG